MVSTAPQALCWLYLHFSPNAQLPVVLQLWHSFLAIPGAITKSEDYQ